MWIWVACGLALVAVLFHPFFNRLHRTGLWAGKALAPVNTELAMPTGLQDALTDGWPSRVALLETVSPFIAALFGFIHVWWAGPVVFVSTILLNTLMNMTSIAPKAVERYIMILHGHAIRRVANYAAKGDIQRAEAAEWLTGRLEELLAVYLGSGVSTPSIETARATKHGDLSSLLSRNPATEK